MAPSLYGPQILAKPVTILADHLTEPRNHRRHLLNLNPFTQVSVMTFFASRKPV